MISSPYLLDRKIMNQLRNIANNLKLVSDADHIALQRLVTEAAWRVDEGKSDTLYELFVENGQLVIGGHIYKGRESIKNWGIKIEQEKTYKSIRHVTGNMRFLTLNNDTADGITILTVFMDDEKSSSIPWVVGEDHDSFVRTKEGWRFTNRRWVQLFVRPNL